MRTTLEISDELFREIKVRAAREGRKLKDVLAELLQRGLASGSTVAEPKRVYEEPKGHREPFPVKIKDVSVPERITGAMLDDLYLDDYYAKEAKVDAQHQKKST